MSKDAKNFIGLNGRIAEAASASVSVMDHGLMYGMGLFETFRTYNGRPFLLQRHLERMEQGAVELGIAWNIDADALHAEIASLLKANRLAEAYIRLTYTAGEDEMGLPTGPLYESPTRIVYIKELPKSPESWYTQGRTLQVLRTPRNTPEGSQRLKSLHYMNGILGRRELSGISGAQGAEGLMLTREGHIAEGIVSNLFFVKSGRLYTPTIDTGILPGITRAFVLELAAKMGIKAENGIYALEDLKQADEIFLTGSVQEIVPVRLLRELNAAETIIGKGCPGELTLKLTEQYRHYTKETGN